MSASARAAAASALVSSLPAALAASVWRAGQMASSGVATTPTGHALLDQILPVEMGVRLIGLTLSGLVDQNNAAIDETPQGRFTFD